MEKILFFSLHYLIPLVILYSTVKQKSRARIPLIAITFLKLTLLIFLFLWGQYPLVGSYYMRYVLIALVMYIIVVSTRSWKKIDQVTPHKKWHYGMLIPVFLFSLFMSFICIRIAAGKGYDGEVVQLEFPLGKGTFYVANGGSNSLINNHFRSYPNSQRYALDINKLGMLGSVSSNILSSRNEFHYIYDENVYCPCNGVVYHAVNDLHDNTSASMTASVTNGKGNYVTINCDDLFVSVFHLKQGSVTVNTGDYVMAGNMLGKVGNSGFSQEPHLHLQAFRYDRDSTAVGIPISFAGFTFSRNDLYSIK